MLFHDRPFVGFTFCSAFASGALFAYITASPFVFITLHGISESGFAILFGINASGLILASQVNVALLKRHSAKAILLAACLGNAAAGLGLAACVLAAPEWFPGVV